MDQYKDLAIVLSLVISAITLISTLAWRRDRVSASALAAQEKRLKESLEKETQRLETRVQESMTKSAENNAEIHKLRFEIFDRLIGVMTKDEMQKLLELVLEPVKTHMRRTEAFIDESLRAGLQRRDLEHRSGHRGHDHV